MIHKNTAPHTPVLCDEMLEHLHVNDGGFYVDATLGSGGYSRAILDKADCRMAGIDRDPHAKATGNEMEAQYSGRFTFIAGEFAALDILVPEKTGVAHADGVVMDIGVSSMQLDQAERGFSFAKDGPLDMRMGCTGMTAGELVNEANEEFLADIIYSYGGERNSRRIAAAIVRAREKAPLTGTSELASIVHSCFPKRGAIDNATRTFQALRIYINDELGQLISGLQAAGTLLAPGGYLVAVTFHSLEDAIVKRFMNNDVTALLDATRGDMHAPTPQGTDAPMWERVTRKPILPSDEEVRRNPRARSAKLRAARKMH